MCCYFAHLSYLKAIPTYDSKVFDAACREMKSMQSYSYSAFFLLWARKDWRISDRPPESKMSEEGGDRLAREKRRQVSDRRRRLLPRKMPACPFWKEKQSGRQIGRSALAHLQWESAHRSQGCEWMVPKSSVAHLARPQNRNLATSQPWIPTADSYCMENNGDEKPANKIGYLE